MSISTTSGCSSPARAHGLLAVRGRADHRDVVLRLEQRGEPRPDDLLVVRDDDADRHDGDRQRQLRLDGEAALLGGARAERAAGDRGALTHAEQAVSVEVAVGRPGPSSSTRSASESGLHAISTSTVAPGACLRAFDSASCTIRYAHRSTPAGSVVASPLMVRRTVEPAARAVSISSSSWARPGCGTAPGVAVRVLPQDAEQAAHLVERVAGGLRDRLEVGARLLG